MAGIKQVTFEVDQSSDVPLWVQLRQRLAFLITSGYFQPGDQLPTVRGLASEISINYNTVNKAYLSLVTDGYLESTRGRGVFVRAAATEDKDKSTAEIEQLVEDFICSCRDLGMTLTDIQFTVSRRILQLKREERGEEIPGMYRSDAEGAREGAGRVLDMEETFMGELKKGRA